MNPRLPQPPRSTQIVSAAAALTLLALSPLAQASNLVVNGSFETGDLSGWGASLAAVVNTLNTTDGVHSVNFGNGFNFRFVEQLLPTTVGTVYQLTFDLGVLSPGTSGTRGDRLLLADGGGTELLNVLIETNGAFTPATTPAFTSYAYSFTALSGSTSIRLQTESYTPFVSSVVDKVAVQAVTTPVPEPASLGLWLAGLAVLAGAGRRARRATNL